MAENLNADECASARMLAACGSPDHHQGFAGIAERSAGRSVMMF